VKDLLSSIAVMDVDIDDRDALSSSRSRGGRSHGHIVEETEAHRSLSLGMVARWTDERKRRFATLEGEFYGLNRGSGR
jgi:hypothetical protein